MAAVTPWNPNAVEEAAEAGCGWVETGCRGELADPSLITDK